MARWADAVGALLRFAMSCDAAGASNAQCKCYLSAVIVWLHAGSAAQAWATYQVGLHGCQLFIQEYRNHTNVCQINE